MARVGIRYMKKHSENYKINGTAYIPVEESPLTNEELENLNKFCNEVDKEFIEIGDAGESNHLLVGRFMTDVDQPRIVDNKFSKKVLNILSSEKFLSFIKKICNCEEEIFVRRAQYNEISKNCFVGHHLDKDSNPDYLAAIVLQLGVNFEGGIYRVYNKIDKKKFIDYKPYYGSLLISDCNYPHEVTKVENGKRGSLVFFISKSNGKNLRNISN